MQLQIALSLHIFFVPKNILSKNFFEVKSMILNNRKDVLGYFSEKYFFTTIYGGKVYH